MLTSKPDPKIDPRLSRKHREPIEAFQKMVQSFSNEASAICAQLNELVQPHLDARDNLRTIQREIADREEDLQALKDDAKRLVKKGRLPPSEKERVDWQVKDKTAYLIELRGKEKAIRNTISDLLSKRNNLVKDLKKVLARADGLDKIYARLVADYEADSILFQEQLRQEAMAFAKQMASGITNTVSIADAAICRSDIG